MGKRRSRRESSGPTPPISPADRALFEAVRLGKFGEHRGLDAIRAAIAAGGDVHAVHPQSGFSLLHQAACAWGGWPEAVQLLLAAGADPAAVDKDGRTVEETAMSGVTSALERGSALQIADIIGARRRPAGRTK